MMTPENLPAEEPKLWRTGGLVDPDLCLRQARLERSRALWAALRRIGVVLDPSARIRSAGRQPSPQGQYDTWTQPNVAEPRLYPGI